MSAHCRTLVQIALAFLLFIPANMFVFLLAKYEVGPPHLLVVRFDCHFVADDSSHSLLFARPIGTLS